MKRIFIAALLILSLSASASDEINKAPEPEIVTDPTTVYAKAFWRRPQSNDSIIHAERREWLDTTANILKWQWFLVVEPSPETLAWLETNPFLLIPADANDRMPDLTDAPEWFDLDKAQESRRQSNTFTLAFTTNGKRLYATDSGNGFSAKNENGANEKKQL